MTTRSKDIIVLLGAGASAEAGIPVSGEMISRVEADMLESDDERGLYHHVKSAIHFSSGIKGKFGNAVPFNIETLVNTLYELERNEEHPLYPFIAAWNSRFVALAGTDFGKVRSFRQKILKQLKKWMCPEDGSKASYYKGLVTLQRDLTYPLHVFSLNYDLCVERLGHADFRVETGFADHGPNNPWDWERFVDMEAGNNDPPQLVLYKLHGSINWKRSAATKDLFSVEQIESVDADKMEVIFGREFKLEAADPYLFYAYRFRALSLETKLIVSLGYGFGDPHINKMLTQSLRNDDQRRLLVIKRDAGDCKHAAQAIAKQLDLDLARADQVIVQQGSAKTFLETAQLAEQLVSLIPPAADAPF
ncbi:MAG TPA: SIR2 family protein [Polyangia bacterium]|nr:SIR2 family protein [Polyangia bacterium]